MREIFRSFKVTDVYSLKLALDDAGIPAAVRGEALAGVIGDPFSVWVLSDEDVERAQAVARDMDQGAV
jgi:hypothetical protein